MPLFLEDGSLPTRRIDEQVEHYYNALLDDCNDFRDNLGEVSDNISLGMAMQQFWEDRCIHHAEISADGIGEHPTAALPEVVKQGRVSCQLAGAKSLLSYQ